MASGPGAGRAVGDWLLEQQIGAGSFAVVWKSRHVHSGQLAAIKEINIDNLNKKLQESLASEISVLQRTRHANVVQLLDIFRVGAGAARLPAPAPCPELVHRMPSARAWTTGASGAWKASRRSRPPGFKDWNVGGVRASCQRAARRASAVHHLCMPASPACSNTPRLAPTAPAATSAQEGNKIFLALEYCEGGDLAHYIRSNGRVSEGTARYFLRHLAAGLQELRLNNVIHVSARREAQKLPPFVPRR